MGACEGIRVVDFSSNLAGAIATMILSDNGAEVVKVEPPDGDHLRRQPAFVQWYRGKKSVVLDLAEADARRQARSLALSADVVIESFPPGAADAAGIGYATLGESSPGLVYCSITGFGPRGPYAQYKDHDAVVQAKLGRTMEFGGQVDREGPVYPAVRTASWATAQNALQGVLAALRVREMTGRGQRVETTMVQGVQSYDFGNFLSAQLFDAQPEHFPYREINMRPNLQYLVGVTKDGHWMQFANNTPRCFAAFVRAIDMEDWFTSRGIPIRQGINEEVWGELLLRVRSRTKAEWEAIFETDPNIAWEPFRHTSEAFDHPQVVHCGLAAKVDDPTVGPTEQLAPLITLSATPSGVQGPAPLLGEHTSDVLSALESPPSTPRREMLQRVPASPLEGVVILELATFFAGPFGASLLADLGARVIKIEPLGGDPFRSMQDTVRTTQGKESITLDLKREESVQIVLELARRADVLMHNYRPGVTDRLGLGYSALAELNPRLIYLYAGAYGSAGPSAARPAFHPSFGALCGGALYQAGRGMPPDSAGPMDLERIKRLSTQLLSANEGNPDPTSAMTVGSAILMGLLARERTGLGQYVETSMLLSNLYANGDDFLRYEGKPARVLPHCDGVGFGALDRLYRCREGWVLLQCPLEEEWRQLCRALGRDDLLSDRRFTTSGDRDQHDAELVAELAPIFESDAAERWETVLTAASVGCVVADAGRHWHFFLNDPHTEANELSVMAEHPVYGPYRRYAPNVEFSLTPGVAGGGTRAGEHTQAILRELGFSTEAMEDLRTREIVAWP